MIVQCPRCETTFSLADELYQVGRKVRCSQCKNVFALPEVPPSQPADEAPSASPSKISKKASGKRQKLILLVAFLVVLTGIGYGGYMLYSLFTKDDPSASFDAYTETVNGLPEVDKDALTNIVLGNVWQIMVNNSKIGKLTVVQGDIVNNSDKPKQMLSVRVFLLDQTNAVLTWQQQIGGVVLSQFQLETLGEEEIKTALNSTINIVVNNTDVQPGEKVPFQVVFFNAPTPKYFDVIPVVAKDADAPLQNISGEPAKPVQPAQSAQPAQSPQPVKAD